MATWFFPRNLAALSSLNSGTLILEVEPTDKLKRKSHLNQTEGHSYTPGPAMTCSQVSSLEIQLSLQHCRSFPHQQPSHPLGDLPWQPQHSSTERANPFYLGLPPQHLHIETICFLLSSVSSSRARTVMFICLREGLDGIGPSYILLDDKEMKSGGVWRLKINFCND